MEETLILAGMTSRNGCSAALTMDMCMGMRGETVRGGEQAE
jgi:hypothetical protein